MTKEEIRQKAIECGKAFDEMCDSNECENGEKFNFVCHCEYNEVPNCSTVYGYEHGFADGVNEERRRIYEEYCNAVKADREAFTHGDMFPKNVRNFWPSIEGADEMSEKPLILVVSDTINTDKPSCVVCGEANKGTVKMLVTYIGNGADEVYKMVSEPGYLYKYNDEIRAEERNKVLDEVYKIITDQMIKHGTGLNFNLETQGLILRMKGETV